jgi:hypothetical protein
MAVATGRKMALRQCGHSGNDLRWRFLLFNVQVDSSARGLSLRAAAQQHLPIPLEPTIGNP